MYSQDSFFDLTSWGQFGLLCISATLLLLMLGLARAVLSKRPAWVRVTGALVLFWMFVWVSPQIYYQYYRVIFEDLPLQWVIWPPPDPREALEMLVFQGPRNLSAHSQGLLGWILIIVPFLRFSTRLCGRMP